MTRFAHVKFDDDSKKLSKACREACINVEIEINKLPVSREKGIAFTKIQECFMWVNKALCEMQLDKDNSNIKPTLKQAVIIRKVALT